MSGPLIPVLIVFIVVGIPVICGTLIKLAMLLTGNSLPEKNKGRSRKGSTTNDEETQLIQEMHQSLTRLESRIGALETIVIQNERPKS